MIVQTTTTPSYAWAPPTIRHLLADCGFGVRGLSRSALGDIVWAYDHNGGPERRGVSLAVSLGHRLEVPRAYWKLPVATSAPVVTLIGLDVTPCDESHVAANVQPAIVTLARSLRCSEWSNVVGAPYIFRADVLGLPTMFAAAYVRGPIGRQYRGVAYD